MRWYLISNTISLLWAFTCLSNVNSTSLFNHDGGYQDDDVIDQVYHLPNLKHNQEVKVIVKEMKDYSGQNDLISFKDYHFQKRTRKSGEPLTIKTGSSLENGSSSPTRPSSSSSPQTSPERPPRSYGADLRDTPHRPIFGISYTEPPELRSPLGRPMGTIVLASDKESTSPKRSPASPVRQSSPVHKSSPVQPSSPVKHGSKGGITNIFGRARKG